MSGVAFEWLAIDLESQNLDWVAIANDSNGIVRLKIITRIVNQNEINGIFFEEFQTLNKRLFQKSSLDYR